MKCQYFYKSEFISLLHFGEKLALSIANVFRDIHFLPLFHYFQKSVRFVIFQINVDFLTNHLQNYFYTKHLRSSFISEKKFSEKTFIFSTYQLVFTNDELHNISKNLLILIISHKRLNIPPLFRKKMEWSPSQIFFFWNNNFFPYFHYFKKWVRFVIFQVNIDFLINQLTKHFNTRHLTPLPSFK